MKEETFPVKPSINFFISDCWLTMLDALDCMSRISALNAAIVTSTLLSISGTNCGEGESSNFPSTLVKLVCIPTIYKEMNNILHKNIV